MKKLFKTFLLITLIIPALYSFSAPAQAQDIIFDPQIEIPGFKDQAGQANMQEVNTSTTTGYSINENSIGVYIKTIYNYAIGIVGIVAAVVIMYGGVLWITAFGNAERISNAKSWITAAVSGLVLVIASYTILYTVNPDLTSFKPIKIGEIEGSSYCQYQDTSTTTPSMICRIKTKKECEALRGTGGFKDYETCNNTTVSSPNVCPTANGICTTINKSQGYCEGTTCKYCIASGQSCSENEGLSSATINNYKCCSGDCEVTSIGNLCK